MGNRPALEETFLSIALDWSRRSTCSSRIAVGAVLANSDSRIIASGFNGSPKGFPHCDDVGCDFDNENHCKRALHAELNAILQCATNGISARGTTLYITHSPCIKCCSYIIQVGVNKVVFAQEYRDLPTVMTILDKANIYIRQFKFEKQWLED